MQKRIPQALALSPDNATLYAVTSGSGPFEVSVIDTATGSATNSFQGIVGDESPVQIAVAPDGKSVYVVIHGSDEPAVNRIDVTTNEVVQVSGIVSPTAITFSIDGKRAYVADACPNFSGACIDIVDTTVKPPNVTSTLAVDNFFYVASIAITADGSIVCMSVADANFDAAVACADPTSLNSPNIIPLSQVIPTLSTFGMVILPNNVLYLSEGGSNSPNDVAFLPVTLTTTPEPSTVVVGQGPTGLAIGPGGGSIYVSNFSDSTISVIDVASSSVNTISNASGGPQGIAAMTLAPPVISTQPSSQTILTGTTATLSVVATSSAPSTLQWYQGVSGDTSTPIEGAVGSTYVTPALTTTTSYWVQVTNIAGPVNSNTATITVTTNHPPNCTLVVVGAGSPTFTNPLGVIATATCPDPQGAAVTATIDFGDGSPLATGPTVNNVFTATHTYAGVNTYPIHVTATNSFGLQSSPAFYSWTLVPTTQAPPVFSGQTSTVTVTLSSPSGQPETVTFECTTVTTVNGTTVTFTPATAVGISCNSVPDPITLTSVPQTVTLEIHTTGPAVAQARHTDRQIWAGAFLFPLPVFALVGIGCWPGRSRRRKAACITAAALVLLALSVSCGGGFKAPTVQLITPPGNYQVTVIDLPSGTQSGFVQTSLIVPLTVSPFQ